MRGRGRRSSKEGVEGRERRWRSSSKERREGNSSSDFDRCESKTTQQTRRAKHDLMEDEDDDDDDDDDGDDEEHDDDRNEPNNDCSILNHEVFMANDQSVDYYPDECDDYQESPDSKSQDSPASLAQASQETSLSAVDGNVSSPSVSRDSTTSGSVPRESVSEATGSIFDAIVIDEDDDDNDLADKDTQISIADKAGVDPNYSTSTQSPKSFPASRRASTESSSQQKVIPTYSDSVSAIGSAVDEICLVSSDEENDDKDKQKTTTTTTTPSTAETVTEELECVICGRKPFQSKDDLISHVMAHVDGVKKCEFCVQNFETTKQMSDHFVKDHGGFEKNSCSKCSKRFWLERDLARHVQRCHL